MTGRHFTLDGWAVDESGTAPSAAAGRLADEGLLATLLDELVVRVGMEVLKPAEILTVPPQPTLVDGDEDCGGSTGVVILTTSHASIHTWPLRGRVSFDLYSCRDFDAVAVLDFITERLGLTGGGWRSFERSFEPGMQQEFREVPLI